MNNKTLFLIIITTYLLILCIGFNDYQEWTMKQDLSELKTEAQSLEKVQQYNTSQIEELYHRVSPVNPGKASYYDYKLDSGWSSVGHRVCASRDFPRGTTLHVENLANGKKVDCLVTDYGPDASVFPDRVIDLSSFAFSQISSVKMGVILVSITK